MFARHKRILGALYLAGDALAALASFGLAAVIRSNVITPRPLYPVANYLWIVPATVGIWLGVGLALGIYRDIRDEEFSRLFLDPIKVALVATTLLFAITFAFKLVYISRLLLGFYALSDFVLMVLFRLVARRLSVGEFRHFLLVGTTPEAMDIARTLEAGEHRGLRLVGFARVEPGPAEQVPPEASGLRRAYPLCNLSQLPELLRRAVIDEVVFAVGKDDLEKLEETFLRCEEEGVKTRLVLSFFPHVISKVSLERLRDTPLLTFSTTPEDETLLLLKRVLDFLMAFVLLVVLSPLLLVLAALIKLTSKGPVLFRQTRCGLGGRKFTLLKFRSMHPDADLRREELEALNEMDGPVFKIRDDPRCTAVGRFMRKFSLDELPQLVNVLKGEMSFVGPRPPLPEEVDRYEPWQRRRLRMQPGLTCLWALEGRSKLSFRRWMELDLQYIDNWSPALDLKIFLRTIPVVLLGRGAS
jgi:exopolysaccharide biosynthesis polyprenyl glycosylphosphotransferase